MRKTGIKPDFVMHLAALLILATATFVSTWAEPNANTIIPRPDVAVPVINAACTVAALALLFIKRTVWLECAILIVQAVTTALTGYETLAIFLYTALILILFCDGFFKTQAKRRILILFVAWLIVLPGIIPQGIDRYIMAMVESVFFLAFYFCIYKKLETLLSPLMTMYTPIGDGGLLSGLEKGAELSLASCGLDEREAKFTYDFLKEGKTYREIGETHYTSTSTVKKVMAGVCRKFGVKNQNELRLLLLQYKVTR